MLMVYGQPISKWKIALFIGDISAYLLSLAISFSINPKIDLKTLAFLSTYKLYFFLMGSVYLLAIYLVDLYDYQRDYRRLRHIAKVLLAVMIGAFTNIVLFYFILSAFVGRILLISQVVLFAIVMVFWRYTFSATALHHRLRRRIIIVGAGNCGRRILQALRNRPFCGLVPQGFVDDDPQKTGKVIDGLHVLGNSSQLQEIVSKNHASMIVVAVAHEKSQQLISILTRLSWNGFQVIDMPSLYEYLANRVPIEHISNVWFFFNCLNKNKIYSQHIKKMLDLMICTIFLLFSAPLFALIALLIKLDSQGDVFYCQERLGYEGQPFRLIKFRTMIQNAEPEGPKWAEDNDSRITRVGYILRKFRLDELPQLINVLKGEMSFIGPRPEREFFIREFQKLIPESRLGRRVTDSPETRVHCGYKEQIPYLSYRLLVKPGITGWAQVTYPYASSLEQAKEKLGYDLYYVKNIGFFLDMAILLKTFRIVLIGQGK